jgi:hypothetical protein
MNQAWERTLYLGSTRVSFVVCGASTYSLTEYEGVIELEQKQLHLLQVVESERTSRWQYAQQCDELTHELKQLRVEVRTV